MANKIIGAIFRALIVVNAVMILGAVGSMELGEMGLFHGIVLCAIHAVVIGICWKWRNA